MSSFLLHIVISTADGPEKCDRALAALLPDLGVGDVRLTLLHGGSASPDTLRRWAGTPVELRHFPGETVWHLRRRLPELVSDCEWLLLLEDHNQPLPGWLPALREVLARTPAGTTAVLGATSNLTSTEPWSWANFLTVQCFHWTPQLSIPVRPLPFNAAFRRRLLPSGPWTLGYFETQVMRTLMRQATGDAGFPVDHIQHRPFPGVLRYHHANGRATGAYLRQHAATPARHLGIHLLHVLLQRPWQAFQQTRHHPLAGSLPRGTRARMYALSIAHAAGAVHGFLRGEGRALELLE